MPNSPGSVSVVKLEVLLKELNLKIRNMRTVSHTTQGGPESIVKTEPEVSNPGYAVSESCCSSCSNNDKENRAQRTQKVQGGSSSLQHQQEDLPLQHHPEHLNFYSAAESSWIGQAQDQHSTQHSNTTQPCLTQSIYTSGDWPNARPTKSDDEQSDSDLESIHSV